MTPDPRTSDGRRGLAPLLGFCLAIGFLTYGYALSTVILSIDQEVANYATPSVNLQWIGQGRWSSALLNWAFLPYPIVPVVTMTLGIFGLAASYTGVASLWRRPIGVAHYAAAPFAIAFPTLIHLFAFPHHAYAVALGFILAALGVALVARERLATTALAVPPLTFAIATYQPTILFPVVCWLILAAFRLPEAGVARTLRGLGVFAGVLAAAFLLHVVITRILLIHTGIGPSAYIDQFLRPGDLLAMPGLILMRSLGFTWSVLSGGSDLFLGNGRYFGATMLTAVSLVLWSTWRAGHSLAERALQLALIAAAVGGPLMVVAINDGDLPYRNLFAAPLGIAALVFLALARPAPRPARWLLVGLCGLCCLDFAEMANRLFWTQQLVLEADRDLANRIINRIDRLERPQGQGEWGQLPSGAPTPMEVVGSRPLIWPGPFPTVIGSTLGASFFEWDGGNPERIALFMRSLGYLFTPVSPGQRAALQPEIAGMPVWPNRGAVRLIDGVVVVKLSPYTAQQRSVYGMTN